MEYVVACIIGTVISWGSLMFIIPVARKIAEFSMPPWPETMWKLAVVSLCGNFVDVVLTPVNVFVSLIVGAVVFWTLMVKWFDVDWFGAMAIVIASCILRVLLLGPIIGLVMGGVL